VEAVDTSLFELVIVGIRLDGSWVLLDDIPEGDIIESGEPVQLMPGRKCLITVGREEISFDVVFPLLHGPNGEDGSIQGLLQILDVPFVGPHVLGSALAMDKAVAKVQLQHFGIPVARGHVLSSPRQYQYEELVASLGLPFFVKPANMGSSVGVHKVKDAEGFEKAITDAFQYDHKVIVEEMIEGRELECAVLGSGDHLEVTRPGEIVAEEEYSFEEKYADSSETRLDIPARNLDEETIDRLKTMALDAFRALNGEIMSRVDMFLTENGEIYVNEVNTIPGFTNISMYPQLWEKEGIAYTDLITKLVEAAIARHGRQRSLKRSRV
jgi:D-alanine-D-alanine ligase